MKSLTARKVRHNTDSARDGFPRLRLLVANSSSNCALSCATIEPSPSRDTALIHTATSRERTRAVTGMARFDQAISARRSLSTEDLTQYPQPFYGSPTNFSSTKPQVLKPAASRVSRNTVPIATPTSSLDSPLQTKKYMEDTLFVASFLVPRAAMKRSLKKIAGFGGTLSQNQSNHCFHSLDT